MANLSLAILATLVLYLICVVWICLYIRRMHPAVWAELDEPLPLKYLLRHTLGLSRFIWRDYSRLGDERLLLYVSIGRGLTVVFVVLLVTWILTQS